MYYHFRVHKEKGGEFWAECIELKGCVTQGRSLAELRAHMVEALNLYLSEPAESKVVFPEPKRELKGRHIEMARVEPKIAFALRLRQLRKKKRLSQMQVAKMLNYTSVYGYQRLEDPAGSNPEFDTIVKLKKVHPELTLDEIIEVED